MRTLVLLRGVPSSGKSRFLKENNLEQYTLSADNIRLLFQSPVMNNEGGLKINPKHDGKVWNLLFELLEERMKRGEFSIIDATHSKTSAISRYKKLAQKYRYRVYVVDFSDVPLETALERNRNRPKHKFVPEQAILNIHERMSTERVPRWTTLLKPEEYQEVIQYTPANFDNYDRINIIGDIHGCFTALMKYLKGSIFENELYIFTGDYLDRGVENAEVLNFLIEIADEPNTIFLSGNHERWLHMYGSDEEDQIRNRSFLNQTKPDLDDSGIDKKEIRSFTRRLGQVAYFTYGDTKFLVTHGGVSNIPDNLMHIATDQFINGVGEYSDDIDYLWEKSTGGDEKLVQIHGHRNLLRLPTQAGTNSYNLEGGIERGEYLRAVTIDKDGIHTHEVKNDIFNPNIIQKPTPSINEETVTVEEFLDHLSEHKYVKEMQLPNNISSFNFTREAFRKKNWDDVNVRARGLFINKNTNEIVNRGYHKFFNVNERSFTKMSSLANTLQFPVTVYNKLNGYLGLVGYNSETDELVFSSKSFTSDVGNQHAMWLEDLFYETFNSDQVEHIKGYISKHNVSLVFEVILPEKDPHIIEYKEDKLVLLDIIKRTLKTKRLPFYLVQTFARPLYLETKQIVHEFDNWTDFYRWYQRVSEDMTIEEEGYVIEDDEGFMTKLKLPYYNLWKHMRGIKHKVGTGKEQQVNTTALYTPTSNRFFAWAKNQDKKYLKENSIITIRNDFERSQESK